MTDAPERTPARDLDAHADLTALGKVAQYWPTWVLVLAFSIIALCMALTGVLDDWLRAVLTACFGAIALVLAVRVIMLMGGRAGTPPEPQLDPPPSDS